MKTNLMKKAIMFATVSLMLFAGTAFTSTKMNPPAGLDYYYFIEVVPYHGLGEDKNRYYSDIMYYSGTKSCEDKAKEAFDNYLRSEYSDYKGIEIALIWNPWLSSYRCKTKQQAQELMNKNVADGKKHDEVAIKTNFTYSCE